MPPFDGPYLAPVVVPTAPVFDFDTASPDERLLELARLLENEQEWRDTRMEWNFGVVKTISNICGTAGCAIGLALQTWPSLGLAGDIMEGTTAFAVDMHEWSCLFGSELARRNYPHGDILTAYDSVTPGHVATAIRQFVSNRGA